MEWLTGLNNQINNLNIVTVVIENATGKCPPNASRLLFMKNIIQENIYSDIILFPAGYFNFDFSIRKETKINGLCDKISSFLFDIGCNSVVCVGIDCSNGRHQFAVAVNKDGIQALARKFYPTDAEHGYVRNALSFNCLEMGYPRVLNIKNSRVYLAVCYDVFGIKHHEQPNDGVDIVLTLAHQFWKRGEGPSGDVDFARKGFAGASQHWKCPVFGTAVFYCREIPQNWPTGILWVDSTKNVRQFTYDDNQLSWSKRNKIIGKTEIAICYTYSL